MVDSDELFTRALVRALRPHAVEVVQTSRAARECIAQRRHTAWIFEVRLPDGDGIDLLRWARGRDSTRPALVVSAEDPRRFMNAANDLGAEVLGKPVPPAHVRRFFERSQAAGSPLVLAAQATASAHGLTPRPRAVLILAARGIPRALFAQELGVSESTVKTTIRRLLDKLGANSLDDIVRSWLREADERPPLRPANERMH